MKRNEIKRAIPALILGALAVYLVIAAAIQGASRPDLIPIFNIVLVAGLVAVTAFYAYFTLKMAEEMRKARYDTVRPVIDIQLGGTPEDRIESILSAESGNFPGGLPCSLHNIGLGPAIDIYSYIQFQQKSLRNDFGTLAVKARTEKDERLTVFQEDSRPVLKVFYKDIYGRCFKGSREVRIGKVTSSAESGLGPLKSILVGRSKPK